ncbi:prepilin peptidase [Candidatus Liberibacter sp.]|uniref:A24 family peptidase n=1 Tax=Candidatus Liberibacter sp. TaxID=34022 RepID=UPI0015F4CA81|nr:prepilin peptidase [Candidatus Liberibacter sp.]MBA5723930.1 prepilin peptidase [Candidatus Liberibacter sp.]
MIFFAVFFIVPFCLAMAALFDLFSTRIPNWISIVIVCSYVLVTPFMKLGFMPIAYHFIVGFIVFIICFGFFVANIMGGGDVKLLTSLAIWFGWDYSLLQFFVFVSVFGGILSMVVLLMRSYRFVILSMGLSLPKSFLMKDKIPYGLAIAAGGFASYPDCYLFRIALEQGPW